MQRRSFLRNIGLGASALAMPVGLATQTNENAIPQIASYQYPLPASLHDALSDEGFIAVRLVLQSASDKQLNVPISGSVKVKGARLARIKPYYFQDNFDTFNTNKQQFQCKADTFSPRFLVLWIDKPTDNTQVTISLNGTSTTFTLSEILAKQDIKWNTGNVAACANLLLYNEIGPLTLEQIGGRAPNENFEFVVMADPQGGDPTVGDKLQTRMKIHNAFIEESVELVNQLQINPAFTVVVGDIVDAWGYEKDFRQMNTFLKRLSTPVFYTIGNHESELRLNFGPGYNMSGFNNYFAAQKDMNGTEKMLYSFNAGQWHFVVWPDPLRDGFWESHPHYFDWLERDLEKHKNQPVMLFQHVPVHPVGLNPHIDYAESVFVKRTFLDILARYGNVKYVLSGHVHIPIKAAFKIACTMYGIRFINLPATGYRQRNFGEEDVNDGISQGVTLVKVEGAKARITYKSITEDEYVFPDELPELDLNRYKLWLGYKHELPAAEEIINGNFEQGLNGWTPRWIYTEDENPANHCEVRPIDASFKALFLSTRKRGFATAGQDRLPQDMNRVCQAIKVNPRNKPAISLRYMPEAKNCDLHGYCGGYIWIEGFAGNLKQVNLMYSANKVWYNIGGRYDNPKYCPPVMLDLDSTPDQWHEVYLNIADDYNRFAKGARYEELNIDRIVINFGAWNINYGSDQPFALYYHNIKMEPEAQHFSKIDGKSIEAKPEAEIWWQGKDSPFINIGGDHRIFLTTPVAYTKKTGAAKKP